MKVKLVKAVRLSPIRPLCLAGSVVEVDEATYGRLVELDAVEVEADVEAAPDSEPVAEVESEATPEPEPVVEAAPEPEPEQEPEVEPAPVVSRPAKSAPEDKWRAYAESLGLDVKGLKKPEIIAAVSKVTA